MASSRPSRIWSAIAGFASCAMNAAAAAQNAPPAGTAPSNPATAQELPNVVVIGTVPLPGLGQSPNQVPGNVQTATAEDLKRQQSLDLTELLNTNFSGVNISESQDNPFQADVNYHGFTASPLLGTPQGLSVYVDGVRVNEAFGDTVNWDLIPESAIGTVSLLSGSSPVFGLNTLGGALSVQTKSGHDYPGTQLQGYAGSFGRRVFEAETGGSSGGFDYFLTGNYFDEDGWRDLSPSKVKQLFGKAGWQDELTDVDLSYTWADTDLTGNGTTPESLLAVRRAAIFTAPDFTNNTLNFVNLTATHFLTPELLLSANAYYRHLRTRTNNGDLNDDNYLSEDYSGPEIDCDLAPESRAEVAFCANGINRASAVTQRTAGLGAQLTWTRDLGTAKNQAIVGVSFDRSKVDYDQAFQYGLLAPDRTVVAIDDPNNSLETITSVGGTSEMLGVYFTDTVSPNSLLHVTLAARYNRIHETLSGSSVDSDLGDFGDGFDAPNALSGDHTYSRVNPSIGLTITPRTTLTFYANYNEGSRAPTVIELGCSDPAQPCGLPNDFASDPDLKQVVSRTIEAGARGSRSDRFFDWSIDLFRTRNSDDIEFVATSTSQGYFANVGDTRRQGLDVAVGGEWQRLKWRLVYSWIDATYESSFSVHAESNSTADSDGDIQVSPGDRIPLIPREVGRLRLDFEITDRWHVGGSVVASSGSYLHGNENNANQPDGAVVIGSGRLGGYATVNLESGYRVAEYAEVFVKAVNVLDRHYATAGFLTSNAFEPGGAFRPNPDDWTNENAVSPAQPFGIWAGIRLHWD